MFGEWCYQKHSVPYDVLPNFFVIFDYFEAKSGKFLSRKRLEEKVGKRFPIIRIITKKKF